MTWDIGGLKLPDDPGKVSRRVIRKDKTLTIDLGFPNPFESIPQKFELTISGFIWPQKLADSLWERLKNPETETIKIVVSELSDVILLDGTYSVEKVFIDRDRPYFININGTGFKAYKYSLTFAEFSKDIVDGDDGGPEGDEKTNFFDIPETGGLNDLTEQDAINIFLNVFTLGALEP